MSSIKNTITVDDNMATSLTNSITGTSYSYNYSNLNTNVWNTTSSITINDSLKNTLHVRGDANIEGDLTVNGRSVAESLEKIEERLAILRPNEELEAKWENLRSLRQAYMELEKELLEKEKVWGILKK